MSKKGSWLKKGLGVFVELPEDEMEEDDLEIETISSKDPIIPGNDGPNTGQFEAQSGVKTQVGTKISSSTNQKLVDPDIKNQIEAELNQVGGEKIQNFLTTLGKLREAGQSIAQAFVGALAVSEVTNQEVSDFILSKESLINQKLKDYLQNADIKKAEALNDCNSRRQTLQSEIKDNKSKREELERREQELEQSLQALSAEEQSIESHIEQAKRIFTDTCEDVKLGLESEKHQLQQPLG